MVTNGVARVRPDRNLLGRRLAGGQAVPPPDQRDDIAAGLATVTDHGLLSEHQVREIVFVSGLPMPAHAPSPPETSPAPPPSRMISRLRGLLGRRP